MVIACVFYSSRFISKHRVSCITIYKICKQRSTTEQFKRCQASHKPRQPDKEKKKILSGPRSSSKFAPIVSRPKNYKANRRNVLRTIIFETICLENVLFFYVELNCIPVNMQRALNIHLYPS